MPLEETAQFYEEHVRRFGYSYRALGFGRRSSQEKRFAAATQVGALHGARLLDVGCGFGDLLAWLNARGIEPEYTGIDICAPMIERCRRRFGRTASFRIADALAFSPNETWDYVIASGLFGYAAKDTRARVQPTIERLFSVTRRGMAVNFLSRMAPSRSPGRLYVQPADVLHFAANLTPALRLDHSYLPNDFTLFMYAIPPWEER